MPGVPDSGWVEALSDLVERLYRYWSQTGALQDASGLFFWRDGMLGSLEKIAKGDTSANIFATLEANFYQSIANVNFIISELNEVKRKIGSDIGGLATAIRIDDIVNGSVGKIVIRDKIEAIINRKTGFLNLSDAALDACNDIAVFNDNVSKLHHLVQYGAPSFTPPP